MELKEKGKNVSALDVARSKCVSVCMNYGSGTVRLSGNSQE